MVARLTAALLGGLYGTIAYYASGTYWVSIPTTIGIGLLYWIAWSYDQRH